MFGCESIGSMSARAGSKVATASRRGEDLSRGAVTEPRSSRGSPAASPEALGVDAVVDSSRVRRAGSRRQGSGSALYLIGWLASGDPVSRAPAHEPAGCPHAQPPTPWPWGSSWQACSCCSALPGLARRRARVSVALAAFGPRGSGRGAQRRRARSDGLATRLQRGPSKRSRSAESRAARLAMGTLLVIGGIEHVSPTTPRSARSATPPSPSSSRSAGSRSSWARTYQLARQLGPTSGGSGSGPRSGPRWPRTCTTRCCRRSR